MSQENLPGCRISGSGTASGGVYNEVLISGSGRIENSVKANDIRISGSGKFSGDVETGELRVSGSAECGGALTAGRVHVSGSINIKADADCEILKVSGGVECGGNVRGEEIAVSGGFRCGGGVECEKFSCSGSFRVKGLLNAEQFSLSLGGESSAGEIGGETILVKIGSVRRFFGVYRGKSLKAESIEGTHVTLACAKAKIVRGETVVLGPGCDIDRVEYSKQLTVHEKARVRERVEVRVG